MEKRKRGGGPRAGTKERMICSSSPVRLFLSRRQHLPAQVTVTAAINYTERKEQVAGEWGRAGETGGKDVPTQKLSLFSKKEKSKK